MNRWTFFIALGVAIVFVAGLLLITAARQPYYM